MRGWLLAVQVGYSNDDFYMVKDHCEGHRNNQCRTVLAKMTVSESRKLSRSVGGAGRRGREQLLTLGKLDRISSVKMEHNVPERWTDLVPSPRLSLSSRFSRRWWRGPHLALVRRTPASSS